jgi:hypothetical protein
VSASGPQAGFAGTAGGRARSEAVTARSSYSERQRRDESGLGERSGRDVEPEGLDWDEALGKLFGALEKTL